MKDARLLSRAFADSVSDAVVRVRVFDTQFNDGAFFHELLDLLHAQVECIGLGRGDPRWARHRQCPCRTRRQGAGFRSCYGPGL